MNEQRKKELLLAYLRDEITEREIIEEINSNLLSVYDVAKETGIPTQSCYRSASLRRFFFYLDDKLVISRSVLPQLVEQYEYNKKKFVTPVPKRSKK